MIVPTSIYAPGTRVDAEPADGGPATGAPPRAGQPPGPGAGPAAGYQAPPGYGSPPPPGPAYAEAAASLGATPLREEQPAPEPGYDGSAPGGHPYGDYAYVIREEEAPAPRQPRPRPAGPGMRAPVSEPPPEEPAQPASAYGPGDPAYGPPSAGWYTSEAQAEPGEAEEVQHVRGVFEPPRNQTGEKGMPDGTPPLEQIKAFYLTAEAISAESLDRQFDELLERQRQLISAYFAETALQEDPR